MLIEEKEMEIDRLTAAIKSYKQRFGNQRKTAEANLLSSEFYMELQKKAAKAVVLSNEDWHQIKIKTIDVFPGFYDFISSKKMNLNDKEFKTCILIRLHFTPKDVANMIGVSQAYITKIRNNMMPKLFGEAGNSKMVDERLLQYT